FSIRSLRPSVLRLLPASNCEILPAAHRAPTGRTARGESSPHGVRLFEHFADLAVAAFDDGHLEPRIVAFLDELNLRRSSAHPPADFFCDRDAAPQIV